MKEGVIRSVPTCPTFRAARLEDDKCIGSACAAWVHYTKRTGQCGLPATPVRAWPDSAAPVCACAPDESVPGVCAGCGATTVAP